jgi:glycine cleavage system T protein (aminomethyltransferase)
MDEKYELLQTPLHDWHIRQNANMAEFGGYHMPLWYRSGTKQEHLAVINGAGLFDTSHLAVLSISGKGAFDLLQTCFTKDLTHCIGRKKNPLVPGRSVYGMFLLENGTVLDDAIVSLLARDRFMVVVNCGMGAVVSRHLRKQAVAEVTIDDHSDQYGKIDLQGPAAARILEPLFEDPDKVLADMIYFSFKGDLFENSGHSLQMKDGTQVLLSRTGYTGEFGFELFVNGSDTEALWQTLLNAGKTHGLITCGLAARDSLRAGAGLPLSHQDIGNWLFVNTPWSFALPWDESGTTFSKQFIGAEAVSGANDSSFIYGFAGYDPRKIPLSENTLVMDSKGNRIGGVLTCTTDMAIDRVEERIVSVATAESAGKPADFRARGLCCGFVKTDRLCRHGEQLLLTDRKRKVTVEIRADVRPDRTAHRPMQQMRTVE